MNRNPEKLCELYPISERSIVPPNYNSALFPVPYEHIFLALAFLILYAVFIVFNGVV